MKMNWPTKKLGELFEITSSKRVFKSEWVDSGIPFYRAREIVSLSKGQEFKTPIFITEEMYEKYKEKYGVPKVGDLLATGVGTLGICYRIKKDDKFYFKDGNIIWFKNISGVDSRFVELYFQSRMFKEQVGERAGGATVKTFTIKTAKNIEIPYPPLEIQKKIVANLEGLLAKVGEAKKLRAEAREAANNLLPAELHKIFAEGKKKGWDEKNLVEISSDIKSGFACSKKNEVSDGVVHLRTHNIDVEGNLNFDKITKIPEQLIDKNAFGLEKGDILFNNTNSTELVGKTAFVKEDFPYAFSNHLTRIKVDTRAVLPKWVVHAFNTYWRDKFFESVCSRWVGQSGINQTILKSIKIILPPLTKQKEVVAHLDSISQKIQFVKGLHETTKDEFDVLERSILSNAFSGNLI